MTPDAPAALGRKVFALLAQAHVAERADRCGWAGTWGVDVLQSSQFNPVRPCCSPACRLAGGW